MNNIFKKKFNIELFLISVLIPQFVGLMSSALSGDVKSIYDSLEKPPFSLPYYIFPIIWGMIYFIIGVSFYLISQKWELEKHDAYFYYTTQLGINFLWSLFFFGMGLKLFSFFWIILLIVFVYLNLKSFYKIDKKAGILIIPYLIWIFYIAYLNFGMYIKNK